MENPKQKKTRREARAKSDDDGTTQTPENPLNSNTYLTYDILRIIFRYINSKDLSSAAMVCRSWSEAANKERQTRGPSCISYFLNVNNGAQFLDNIRDLRIKPSLVFYFTKREHLADFKSMREELYRGLLHKNCTAIIVGAMGILLDDMEIGCGSPNILCAFLPEIPNVVINAFKVTDSVENKNDYDRILNMINEIPTPNHETSTCLMLFCNDKGRDEAITLATAIKDSNENKITSLYGGVVRSQYIYSTNNWTPSILDTYCIGILISGPIQTWSIIVDRKCATKEQIETRLRSWKDRIKLGKHSMGFMFACHAREGPWRNYQKGLSIMDWKIFKKCFPKVPLMGCFGDGEFGKNTISVDATDESCKNKNKKLWYNEYSTVFMILTYG